MTCSNASTLKIQGAWLPSLRCSALIIFGSVRWTIEVPFERAVEGAGEALAIDIQQLSQQSEAGCGEGHLIAVRRGGKSLVPSEHAIQPPELRANFVHSSHSNKNDMHKAQIRRKHRGKEGRGVELSMHT